MALLAVLAVSVLTAGFLQLTSAVTRRQGQSVDTKRAFYMAEAGLAEAYVGLWAGKTGNVGTPELPAFFAGGLFWVEATELAPDLVQLRSTGRAGAGVASLSLVARRGEESVASLGFFSASELSIQPGTLIDSFDSGEGPYEYKPPVEGEPRHTVLGVGSNEGITVSSTPEYPTEIQTAVTPGPEQTVETVGDPTIAGPTDPRVTAAELPAVTVPDITLEEGIDHSGAEPLVLQPGEHGLQSLTLRPGSTAVLTGPATLVVGALSVEAGAELILDSEQGGIEVFVEERLDFELGSSVVTTAIDPSLVSVQVSRDLEGEPACILGAETTFHGMFYAPEAEIRLEEPFELFGALAAERIDMRPGVRLHFDLGLIEFSSVLSMPELISWRIVQFPATVPGSPDPFQEIGADPSSLPRPPQAHEDQTLEVTYKDLGGVVRSYNGLESAFDWSDVQQTYVVKRDGKTSGTSQKAGGQQTAM